ncbi:MAG TPA: GGDEF domain-containing protein [Mycobacteriales bacterium]|nr:GGDEF domain-containing protein [Mycobacteriales bacterium]HWB68130.1 GGDEF domain-containing protein [Mycobacteriales bacterium]
MKELWRSARHLRLWFEFFAAGVVISAVSLGILAPGVHEIGRLVASAAVCTALTLGGVVAFGTRSRFAQLWPVIAGLVGLGIAGILTTGLAPALGGLFVLAFVYIGLTQPPWTGLALVPLAAAGWLELNRPITHDVVARLPVAVSLWILLAELLSRFSAERDRDKGLLAVQATRDALTGLLNRHGLDDLLGGARAGDAIAFLDIDHFKQLNDDRGHAAGDRTLADLGQAVRASLRVQDVAVRYGGEEILVLLPATTPADAAVVVQRLRDRWAVHHPGVTFSAGIAGVGDGGGVEAARQADQALYAAKGRGRNCTAIAAGQREPAHIS